MRRQVVCVRRWLVCFSVLALLGALPAPAQQPVTLRSAAEKTAEDTIERLLETQVSGKFRGQPLADVIAYLSQATGVPMQIDDRALEDASIGSDTPISQALPSMTLRAALNLILGRIDLSWVIKDEVLLVTTPERLSNELVIKVYAVADLVTYRDGDVSRMNFLPLMDTISGTIAPQTWDEVGGPGSIQPFSASGAIVIAQTPRIHQDIARLLSALRQVRDEQKISHDAPRVLRSNTRPAPVTKFATPRYVVAPAADWLLPRVHDSSARQ